jgi:hypothetical protein
LNQTNIRNIIEIREINKGKTLPNLNRTTQEVVRAKEIIAADKG